LVPETVGGDTSTALWSCPITTYTFVQQQTIAGNSNQVGCVVGETVYCATTIGYNAEHAFGRIYSCAGAGGGTATCVAEIDDNYPLVMVAYKGAVAMGMAWGGSVRTLSGTALVEILHVGSLAGGGGGTPPNDAIWALLSFDGQLYAAGYDSTQLSGQRTWVRQYNGSGWLLTSFGGADTCTSIRVLARAKKTFYVGTADSDTASHCYSIDLTSRLLSAILTAPKFVFGSPGVPKQFLSISLRHSALVAGQAVTTSYSLDDAPNIILGVNRRVGATTHDV